MLAYLNGINNNKMNTQVNGLFDWVKNIKVPKINLPTINIPTINIPKVTLPKINLPVFQNKVKQIGAAPARVAFLTLVRTNFLKLADRLADSYRMNPTGVKNEWIARYGGQWESLKAAINQGTKGAKINAVSATTILAITAAALPVLAGMVALVKQIRGNKETAQQAAEDQAAVNDMAAVIDSTPIDQINQAPLGSGGLDTKTILLIGGGAAALYFLTRKK
jgi:hypothetical protein